MGNNHSNTKTLLTSDTSDTINNAPSSAQLTQFTQKSNNKLDTSQQLDKSSNDRESHSSINNSGDNVTGGGEKIMLTSNKIHENTINKSIKTNQMKTSSTARKATLSTSSNNQQKKDDQQKNNQHKNLSNPNSQRRVFLELSNILQAEQYAGILNAGNTCYLSSVLQALYACAPFRERVLSYSPLITKSSNGHVNNDNHQTNSLDRRTLKNKNKITSNNVQNNQINQTNTSITVNNTRNDFTFQDRFQDRSKHNSGPPSTSKSSKFSSISTTSINGSNNATKNGTSSFSPQLLQKIPQNPLNITPQHLQSLLLNTSSNLVRNNFHKRELLKLHSDNLLTALHDMYSTIYDGGTTSRNRRKKPGKYDARKFIQKFHHEKEQFANYMQHDAHEFFGCLLDALHEILEAEAIVAALAKVDLNVNGGMDGCLGWNGCSVLGIGNGGIIINSGESFLGIDQNMASSVHTTLSDISVKKDKKKSIFSKFKKKKKNKITTSQPNINQLENLTENINLEDTTSFKSESTEPEQRILENSENSNSENFKLPKLPSSNLPSNLPTNSTPDDPPSDDPNFNPSSTWIHELFGGTLVNETRCLTCHSISSKEEKFLDLSVDIEADSSLSHCLQTFCTTETLTGDQKYFCEHCGCKVEAHKRMRIKSLPKILCVQLKRFKFQESLGNFVKLSSRVTFPEQLRVDDLMQKCENGENVEREDGELDGAFPEKKGNDEESLESHDPMYQLVSSVIHCGQGPNRGHYIAACRIAEERFLVLDDDLTDVHTKLDDFYGIKNNHGESVDVVYPSNQNNSAETAYILFYQQLERKNM